MKRSISMLIAIITLAALVLCTAVAVAEEEPMTELVSFYEINGKMPEIFLRHTDDRKSSCDGTTKYTERTSNRQNKLTANDRYECKPWAVTVRYPETTRQATILYRNPETRLESLAEGFIKIRRWLKGHERVDDEIEANYVFQARLDEEGRRFDYVDYVCEIDGNTMSIVHTFDEKEQIHYYRVLGDARKAEPKKTKKSSTPKQEEKTEEQETTDWTIQPVETDDEENPPEGTDWTIDGDNDDDNPPAEDPDEESTHWTITGQEPEQDPEPETSTTWTIGGGGDTSDVSLIGGDDWDIGGQASSSQEDGNDGNSNPPAGESTGWSI